MIIKNPRIKTLYSEAFTPQRVTRDLSARELFSKAHRQNG